MNKSNVVKQIESICGLSRSYKFIDARANGRYRLKFELPFQFTYDQIKRIALLPHVEKVYNNIPKPGTHNNYAAVIIDCKPSNT